jgi:hypothetical protein
MSETICSARSFSMKLPQDWSSLSDRGVTAFHEKMLTELRFRSYQTQWKGGVFTKYLHQAGFASVEAREAPEGSLLNLAALLRFIAQHSAALPAEVFRTGVPVEADHG